MTPKEHTSHENTFSDTLSMNACFSCFWANKYMFADNFTHIPRHAPFRHRSVFDVWGHLVELIIRTIFEHIWMVSEPHVAETENRHSPLSRGRRYGGTYTAVKAVLTNTNVLHSLWCHGCSSTSVRHLYDNNLTTWRQTSSSLGSPIIHLTSYAVTFNGALYERGIAIMSQGMHVLCKTVNGSDHGCHFKKIQREERKEGEIFKWTILYTFVSWDWQSFAEFYAKEPSLNH